MRNKLLVAALLLIGVASVAYAAYAQTLTISGTSTVNANWDVKITNITRTSATGATEAGGTPSFTDTTATFDTTLAYPGATATYDVTVTNNGTVNAKLTSVSGLAAANAAAPTYVTYAITGVTAGTTTIAAGGGTNTITVSVTWDALSTVEPTNVSKTATLDFLYDQN